MRKKKIVSFILLVIILMLIMPIRSYAGITIISGATAKSASVATDFAYCYNLRLNTSTLGENKLDPHLMLNAEWGAAVYLATSIYGKGTTGTQASYTTTNNSGIMLGYYQEMTSSLREDYSTGNQSYFDYLVKYYDSNYVENLPTSINDSRNIGRALYETANWYGGSTYPTSTHPIIQRQYYYACYAAVSGPFRPVIWN